MAKSSKYQVVEPTIDEHESRWGRLGHAPMRGTLRQCNDCGQRVWAGNDQQFHTKICQGPPCKHEHTVGGGNGQCDMQCLDCGYLFPEVPAPSEYSCI